MLIFMGIIGAILFLSINPLRWKIAFQSKEVLSIIIEQAIRLVVGGIWSWLGIYFALIETSFSGFVIWWGLPILIAIALDGYIVKESYSGEKTELVGKVWLGIGVLGIVAFLLMVTIYPASTMKARYIFVNELATVTESSIPDTDTNNIGIISEKTARRTGSMLVSEFANSSRYEDGIYSKQILNDETKWVSSIEFESSGKAIGETKKLRVI